MTRDNPSVYRDRKAWVFPRILVPSLGKCFEPRLSSGITLAGCIRPTCTYVCTFFWTRVPLLFFKGRRLQTRRRNETAGCIVDGEYHDMARDEAAWNFSFTSTVYRPARVRGKKGEKLYLSPLSTPARVALMDTGFGIALLRSRNAWQCRFLAIACIIAFSNWMYNRCVALVEN